MGEFNSPMENLKEYDLETNPLTSFANWFSKACELEKDPYAMTLATATNDGVPSARTVLYKGLKDSQFFFVTNYNSRKSKEIEANPKVALCFYWQHFGRQVVVKGTVKKMNKEESKSYFHSRPYESQVASYISNQSSPIDSREELEKIYNEKLIEFKNSGVPYPENWGGFLVEASDIEFFLYGKFRLNDRFHFKKEGSGWSVERLQP